MVDAAKYGSTAYTLLLDREQVSLTGDVCDRVGTSYQAFQTQGNQCNSPVGTCLRNQIKDLLMADNAAVSNGQPPRNLFSLYESRDQLRVGPPGSLILTKDILNP